MPDAKGSVGAVRRWCEAASEIFERCGRPDYCDVSTALGERVTGSRIRVVVVGDFSQGKSTLVNSIVGEDVCSTDVLTTTTVPTVVRIAGDEHATVIERRDSDLRRRTVSRVEAHAVQDGRWSEAVAVLVDVPSTTIPDGLEFVDCPPATGRRSSRLASVEAARNADVALMVTDATQPLTDPEVALLQELVGMLPTIVVVTKCDLAVHWRAVVDQNSDALALTGLTCDVVTTAAPLHRAREDVVDDPSGIPELLDLLLRAGLDANETLLGSAPGRLTDLLRQVRDEQAGLQSALGDRRSLGEQLRQAELARDACDALRLSTVGWQRALDERCDTALLELHEVAETQLAELRGTARNAIAEIDPGKDWETFEPWLRDEAAAVAGALVAAAEFESDTIAGEVLRAFSDGDDPMVVGFAQALPDIARVTPGTLTANERRGTRFVREGFATLGSTSGGLLAFATLGGVVSAAILAPLTVIIGAGLGGTAILSDRRNERNARQERALDSVDRFLNEVADDIDETVAAGLGAFRSGTRDQLMSRLDARSGRLRSEVDELRQSLDRADAARERLARVDENLGDIDDLLERISRRTDGTDGNGGSSAR